jgi:superoxide dismutase
MLKKILDHIWKNKIRPLIDKRNKILEEHHNSFEAFDLPEIKEIDYELDDLELMSRLMQEYLHNDVFINNLLPHSEIQTTKEC